MKTFSTKQAADILGFTSLDSFKATYKRGFYSPSEAVGTGKGYEWTPYDLFKVKIFYSLCRSGVSQKHSAEMIRESAIVGDQAFFEKLTTDRRLDPILLLKWGGDNWKATLLFNDEAARAVEGFFSSYDQEEIQLIRYKNIARKLLAKCKEIDD